jgi:hypothetical protein
MIEQSAFEPSAFLDAAIAEPNTRRPPLTPGDYIATISDMKADSWTGKQDPSKKGIKFNLTLKVQITDPNTQAAQGASEITLFDTIMLDTTPAGGIDMAPGKNTRLGRYRTALGMNEAGQTFVPRQMVGRSIRVKVAHETYQGEIQDKIDSVAKI